MGMGMMAGMGGHKGKTPKKAEVKYERHRLGPLREGATQFHGIHFY